MTCCWCDKRIPILRAITDSKYCSDEHREYAKINAFQDKKQRLKDLRRRHHRYIVDAGILEVSWLDVNGKMRVTHTRVLNISEDGIAFQLPAWLMLGMWFVLQALYATGHGTSTAGEIAYAAHVIGFVFGLLLVLVLTSRRRPIARIQ